MRATITPWKAKIDHQNWCNFCHSWQRDLYSITGLRNFLGWTIICRSCAEDLGFVTHRSARVGDNEQFSIPDDLADAINEFIEAGRRYREFLKRHYPTRLHGVIYAENEDGEMVLYSESSRFNEPIKDAVVPL